MMIRACRSCESAPGPRAAAPPPGRLAVTAGLTALTAVGCVPALKGGHVVGPEFQPRVLVEYAAEGDAPPGTRYALVTNGATPAIYASVPGRAPTLIDQRWRDANGDHFVVWTDVGDAEHFLVPLAPGAPAYRWVYPRGLYNVPQGGGMSGPCPRSRWRRARS